MISTKLLKLCLSALRQGKFEHKLAGHLDLPHPFDRPHTATDLEDAIVTHLAERAERRTRLAKGFTVVLEYPAGMCEKPGETYTSDSRAATWQEAVLEVAQELMDGGEISEDYEMEVESVRSGQCEGKGKHEDVWGYSVRYNAAGKPRLLDSVQAVQEGRADSPWILDTPQGFVIGLDPEGKAVFYTSVEDDATRFATELLAAEEAERLTGKGYGFDQEDNLTIRRTSYIPAPNGKS